MMKDFNIHTNFFLIIVSQWIPNAFANSCQVYPKEYAFPSNDIYRSESGKANCQPYPARVEIYTDTYTHCDGTQLRLTDSDLGSEKNSSSDYKWTTKTSSRLLFIFPTTVNLTTITLYYYSDSVSGLPRLRFYAVPDDFNIWNAPTASYSYVDVAAVPLDGEPAGRRNVSIDFNLYTTKILMYKYRSDFQFAVSEVEFFLCDETFTTSATTSTTTQSYTGSFKQFTTATRPKVSITTITPTEKSTANRDTKANSNTASTDINLIGIGIAVAIVILLCLTAIAVIALVLFLQNSAKRKAEYDSLYSTLCRESVQQIQPQSLHTSNDLYDHIQLSPSTGQAEFISTNETANTNNPPPHQNEYGIHPSVDKDKQKSAKLKITASTISSQDEENSTSELPTYAVVNKKKKQKTEKESVHCPSQNTADQNRDVNEQNLGEDGNQPKQSQGTAIQVPSYTVKTPQEQCTAVKKKPKDRPGYAEGKAPPIPPYTVEELYTAVKKKPKASNEGDNNATPVLPRQIEELYTAVKKKTKVSTPEDEEEGPPIPVHTVEELYSAVQKKSKVIITEDEEDAPPVPPHTLD